jgi:hypothetical protein
VASSQFSVVSSQFSAFRWPLGRFLGGKEKSEAHGPRHFLARFAVAKKKPRNKALRLVE